MTRVVCIANQKGGVGKTTTAVNLSAALGLMGARVLLVDLDAQASATSGYGLDPAGLAVSTYDVVLGKRPIEEGVLASGVEGVDLLPATRELVAAEVELVPLLARERKLAEAIEPVLGRYDFVFVDCPPSLGLLTVNGLAAAHTVLVPLQCEYYALEGLGALLETVTLVQRSVNPRLQLEGVVLTMFDSRNTLSNQVSEDVRRHLGDRVFRSIIPRNVRLSEAPSHGLPGVLYDRSCRGSRAYMELAEEFLERLGVSFRVGDSKI
ncbi:MAG: chromosome partitioning protein ParA [Candidatus Binatia bacterium]|nr:MAG: chromosome partitioning protein ParA [Candidatus Binatia bacterium]